MQPVRAAVRELVELPVAAPPDFEERRLALQTAWKARDDGEHDAREQVLVQGSTSKRELLARHRVRIDQGQRSVLFGLASLSEGVDLPGAYCTHLVVAKLPFAVPDDPVEQTRREWIEAQGRSAFHERSVPEVGIRLAQAVGRLLRTPQDHGRVTVLDPRLAGTAWGRRLLDGLPPYRRVRGRALGVPLGATPGVHAVA